MNLTASVALPQHHAPAPGTSYAPTGGPVRGSRGHINRGALFCLGLSRPSSHVQRGLFFSLVLSVLWCARQGSNLRHPA